MQTFYVLSYDGYDFVDNEKCYIYKWVSVQPHQIKGGATAKHTIPNDKKGERVRYNIEDRGGVTFIVLGNGRLRELSTSEKTKLGTTVRI